MLVSMTGFGESRHEAEDFTCAVEVRSVNNRFLKITVRLSDSHSFLEGEVEKVVKEHIRRGTITVSIRIHRGGASGRRINRAVLEDYCKQISGLAPIDGNVLAGLLQLPGVVEDSAPDADVSNDWPIIQSVLKAALVRYNQMRTEEAAVMVQELRNSCTAIDEALSRIIELTPNIVKGYRDRLAERVSSLLADQGVTVSHSDLLREVSIFADRSDVAEEIVRLRSHLEQFRETMTAEEAAGRKMEFLVQEIHRETNTLGSKANDVEISRCVMEIKNHVERIREIVQNVE